MQSSQTSSINLAAVRRTVDARLAAFLAGKARRARDECLPCEVAEVLGGLVFRGGKRLRPVLCVVGWHAAGGQGTTDAVVSVAASLEMFHTGVLIHDDVMDLSDTRRGHPTAHRALAARHAAPGGSERRGQQMAVLLGDLALSWSTELVHGAGLTGTQRGSVDTVLDAMREEIMYGQYLDVLGGEAMADAGHALRTARLKTGQYTTVRPLHLGAALAAAPAQVVRDCSAYAVPLGEAFQLRDDLLGVFGRSERTGKPTLDDLREGKNTVLMALALQLADSVQRAALLRLVGDPGLDEHNARRVRDLLTMTGAVAAVEEMIADRHRAALQALEGSCLRPAAVVALRQLADAAAVRSS
ncbi:polyprenyl synthetase family protein [Streptomyces sp. NPDC052095]|uniref:polyprenyl synthetase family protein n=1 Tax=unclassified Streptomyces TaxID=2593676 RepID=UPI00344D12B0